MTHILLPDYAFLPIFISSYLFILLVVFHLSKIAFSFLYCRITQINEYIQRSLFRCSIRQTLKTCTFIKQRNRLYCMYICNNPRAGTVDE